MYIYKISLQNIIYKYIEACGFVSVSTLYSSHPYLVVSGSANTET